MKRLSLAVAAVAATAAVTAVSAPLVGATAGDSVHGGGQLPPTASGCVNHFAVNARSDADGTDPRGLVRYQDANCGRYFDGEVFCVRVVNNRASVVVEFRNNRADPNFAGLLAFYEDNGRPEDGRSADFQQNARLTPAQLAARQALGCPPPIHPFTRLVHGNLVIRDN